MLVATLAQRILKDEGIDTQLVIGEAAWRVGPGDGDVIAHSPRVGGIAPEGVMAFAYHAWLQIGDTIIDFTTHSLRSKAASLDAIDGGSTVVLWCPDFLVIEVGNTLSLHEVNQAPREGVACYQELPGLYDAMVSAGLREEVDEGDVAVMKVILANPGIVVLGPSDCRREATARMASTGR